MPEDELGHVHALLLVHLHGDAVAVVEDAHDALGGVDVHLERHHRRVAHLVVRRVHEDLVEDLVQTGHEAHLALHELLRGFVVHPGQSLGLLARPDVRVGAKQDVLQLRLLLVNLLHRLFRARGSLVLGRGVGVDIAQGGFLGLRRGSLRRRRTCRRTRDGRSASAELGRSARTPWRASRREGKETRNARDASWLEAGA